MFFKVWKYSVFDLFFGKNSKGLKLAVGSMSSGIPVNFIAFNGKIHWNER